MNRFNQYIAGIIVMCAALAGCIVAVGQAASDPNMTRTKDGTYIVNTSRIGAKVRGYAGPTPVNVYIKSNKVIKVEPLPNKETPQYFNLLTPTFMKLWNSKTVKAAANTAVDAHTGATFSAKAVARNVSIALEYYQAHKK